MSVTADGAAVVDVAVVGAGPCGLAAAIAAQQAGLSVVTFDRGALVSGIASYPTNLVFFSTAEKLSIGGVPFVIAGDKPTRRDALAYYRAVASLHAVQVRQYETVDDVVRMDDGGFVVRSCENVSGAQRETLARAVVIATGYFGSPNELGVPGEDLPHVTHLFREGHEAWNRDALVVGGGNSAVDAALELYRAGARVQMVHFGPGLQPNIKPWVLPDIAGRIAEGSITAHWNARVTAIEPGWATLSTPAGAARVPADHVYLMLGYRPNTDLLVRLGVPLDAITGIPAHDPATMRTSVDGAYIAGVLASGWDANKTFIENGRGHGVLIAADVVARLRRG